MFNDFQRKLKYIDKKSQKIALQEWSALEKIHLSFDNVYCVFMGALGKKYIHFLNRNYYAGYILDKIATLGNVVKTYC